MARKPCCSKEGLNKGAWTPAEDKLLIDFINLHGEGKWRSLPKRAGLKRCGKSCRLRWLNYLRPDIKRGNITPDEEDLIIRLHKLLGNRWSLIAGRLPGRTDNEIKNYWNTKMTKRSLKGGGVNFAKPNSTTFSKSVRSCIDGHRQPCDEYIGSSSSSCLVVRAKASRCTSKILINNPPTVNCISVAEAQNMDKSLNEGTTNHDYHNVISSASSTVLGSPSLSDDYKFDFKFDFDMDDVFLSDFFNSAGNLEYTTTTAAAGDFNTNAMFTDETVAKDLDFWINWI